MSDSVFYRHSSSHTGQSYNQKAQRNARQRRQTEADADAALAEALNRLPTGEAASEVAKALGLNRKTLYRRALELQGK